jgi:predicted RNA-binding protein (TIGR00451 family)
MSNPHISFIFRLINHQRIVLRKKEDLDKLQAIADYQFGNGAGEILFPKNVWIEYSKNTSRPRHISLDDTLLASFRPTDALFTITIAGAERLNTLSNYTGFVVVKDDVLEFIKQGKNLFAKHVQVAGSGIRPGDEVIIRDSDGDVAAVGKAILTSKEMTRFKNGVAVKTRRGRSRHR